MLTGLTAFCELSNENQHLALCAMTQVIRKSSPHMDKTINRSYETSVTCCKSRPGSESCKFHLQDHMPSASKQKSIPPEPDRQAARTVCSYYTPHYAGPVILEVEDRDLDKFHTPISEHLNRLCDSSTGAANRFEHVKHYTQVTVCGVKMAERSTSTSSSFQLGPTTSNVYQNSLETQLPAPNLNRQFLGLASLGHAQNLVSQVRRNFMGWAIADSMASPTPDSNAKCTVSIRNVNLVNSLAKQYKVTNCNGVYMQKSLAACMDTPA